MIGVKRKVPSKGATTDEHRKRRLKMEERRARREKPRTDPDKHGRRSRRSRAGTRK
jgi:hypothetical protein